MQVRSLGLGRTFVETDVMGMALWTNQADSTLGMATVRWDDSTGRLHLHRPGYMSVAALTDATYVNRAGSRVTRRLPWSCVCPRGLRRT